MFNMRVGDKMPTCRAVSGEWGHDNSVVVVHPADTEGLEELWSHVLN